MSRTIRTTPDPLELTAVRRGQRNGARPPVRRTGTRAAVIAAALAEYGQEA